MSNENNVDYVLEKIRKDLNISDEQHELNLNKAIAESQMVQLQQENDQLKKRVEASESAMLDLMDMLMGGML